MANWTLNRPNAFKNGVRFSNKNKNFYKTFLFFLQELAYEIKERESSYNAVLSKGEQFVLAGHPAPGPIEVVMHV